MYPQLDQEPQDYSNSFTDVFKYSTSWCLTSWCLKQDCHKPISYKEWIDNQGYCELHAVELGKRW